MITLVELKRFLIEEHRREVRIVVIRNIIITFSVLAILVFIYFFALREAKEYVQDFINYFKGSEGYSVSFFVLIAVVVFAIAKFVFDIWKFMNRTKKIEEFVGKIEGGAIAADISELSIHKLTIPLGKFRLHLFPVNYCSILLSKESKTYTFPLGKEFIPSLKLFLSGANMGDVSEAWYELYDGELTSTEYEQELGSIQDFRKFVDLELKDEITEIEKKRTKDKKNYITYLIPTIFIMIIWAGIMYGLTTGKLKLDSMTIFIGMAVVFIIYYAYMYFFKIRPNKSKSVEEGFDIQFKNNVFKRIVEYINPKFRYIMHGHIGLGEFLEMGFFREKKYSLTGNDQIIGKHRGVPFQLCDLSASYLPNFSKERKEPDTVFAGQIFIAKFNKEFKSDVYIVPRKIDGDFLGKIDTSLYLRRLGEEVKLEDPDFMNKFKVYAENQVEARYILSVSLMERIKQIAAEDIKGRFMISFRNNRVSIANNSHLNNFEVSMFKSITKNNQVVKFYEGLMSQLEVIGELKLNLNIWKNN